MTITKTTIDQVVKIPAITITLTEKQTWLLRDILGGMNINKAHSAAKLCRHYDFVEFKENYMEVYDTLTDFLKTNCKL